MVRKEREIKTIYALVLAVFAVFLAVPIIRLLMESFVGEAGTGVGNYVEVLTERGSVKESKLSQNREIDTKNRLT